MTYPTEIPSMPVNGPDWPTLIFLCLLTRRGAPMHVNDVAAALSSQMKELAATGPIELERIVRDELEELVQCNAALRERDGRYSLTTGW